MDAEHNGNSDVMSNEEAMKNSETPLSNKDEEEKNDLFADEETPTLAEIISAILFVAKTPYTAADIRRIFSKVNEQADETTPKVPAPKEAEIHTAIQELKTIFIQNRLGFEIAEVAGGYRLQTSPGVGHWVRQVLNIGKPHRLSKPALETLAIIAYRQPITRAEIEAVRGVNVDAIVRSLLEAQLIRIVGRSELPGKPLLYGTTKLFLEHFGLNSLDNLPGIEQLRRRESEVIHKEEVNAIARMRSEEKDSDKSSETSEEAKAKAEAQEEEQALQEELKKAKSSNNQRNESSVAVLGEEINSNIGESDSGNEDDSMVQGKEETKEMEEDERKEGVNLQ